MNLYFTYFSKRRKKIYTIIAIYDRHLFILKCWQIIKRFPIKFCFSTIFHIATIVSQHKQLRYVKFYVFFFRHKVSFSYGVFHALIISRDWECGFKFIIDRHSLPLKKSLELTTNTHFPRNNHWSIHSCDSFDFKEIVVKMMTPVIMYVVTQVLIIYSFKVLVSWKK